MVFGFLKKLARAGEAKPQPAEPVEHEGFTIIAAPRDTGSGWTTEGIIRATVGGEVKETRFIRADVLTSRDDAVRFSIGKARQIIKEQGERVFDDTLDLMSGPEPTTTFRDRPAPQDWRGLGEYLAGHGHHLALDPAPRQFASGFANLNYLIELDGEPRVLRRPPPGPLPPGAHDMRREHRVLSRLWRAYPLAPRAIHLCEDESVLGARFFIMEYRPGISIGGALPPSLEGRADVAAAIAAHLVDALTALHRVDPAAVDLDTLGRPEGFLARQVAGWAERARLCYDENPGPECRALAGWLESAIPSGSRTTLIHNDFKLDNVLLDPERYEPVAVVDWDMCTRGDPLFDLAILTSYWTQTDDHPVMHALGQMPSAAPGFPARDEVIARYLEATGTGSVDLRFYRVLALFRLAVIFRQLFNLYRRGTATDPVYAGFDAIAAGLLDFAGDVAEGRRA